MELLELSVWWSRINCPIDHPRRRRRRKQLIWTWSYSMITFIHRWKCIASATNVCENKRHNGLINVILKHDTHLIVSTDDAWSLTVRMKSLYPAMVVVTIENTCQEYLFRRLSIANAWWSTDGASWRIRASFIRCVLVNKRTKRGREKEKERKRQREKRKRLLNLFSCYWFILLFDLVPLRIIDFNSG